MTPFWGVLYEESKVNLGEIPCLCANIGQMKMIVILASLLSHKITAVQGCGLTL